MSKILLTGGTGFIGSHALKVLLDEGHELHAVARRAGKRRDGLIWYEADLLRPGMAEQLAADAKAERLLHLAWYAVPGKFWSAPENERWIDASLRLLRAFGEGGGQRAVIAGTCAEYRWGDGMLVEGRTPLEPDTLYGACKHATHVAATAVAAELGVSLAWGRVFFLYGPGEDPERLVSSVAHGLLQGEVVATTQGHQRRDFMHVADVAGAFVALLMGELTGAINFASGQPVPVREIVTLIAAAVGRPDLVRFGALPPRREEPAMIAGASTRLHQELGFRPRFELAAGLAETVEWWRTA